MLRVTVKLLPGGREAAPDIDHKTQAYAIENKTGELRHYPRWSASIWDLVVRSLQRTLRTNPKQQSMGAFPQAIAALVPILKSGDVSYVRFEDMPDFVRPHFKKVMAKKTAPRIEGEDNFGCAYSWDWKTFLGA